jgi:hypothetical protein
MVNPPINVILNSYVSLPEGKSPIFPWFPLKMATDQFPKFFWQSLVLPPKSPALLAAPAAFQEAYAEGATCEGNCQGVPSGKLP